jgi:polyisoprenyl-phosphate glycosyltransferase
VKILRMSTNFGSWSAVLAGFHAASGDAVIWMSCDLQDPPELIPQMVQRWEEGADVVWAVRAERHDPGPRRFAAFLFYRLLRLIAIRNYPASGTDIGLIDRRVAFMFGQLKERNRFTQGLIMSLGFTQVTVPYVRGTRGTGSSKFNVSRLLKIGMDMIVGFSYFPLRLTLYIGLVTALATGMLAATLVTERFVLNATVAAWWWLSLAIFFFGALNLITVGVLGEYVWRILDQVRERPHYVIRDRVGFEGEVSERGTEHG